MQLQSNRPATDNELKLIKLLAHKAKIPLIDEWEKYLVVVPMDDGNMGSLKLYPNGAITPISQNIFVSECQFLDSDNVVVLASLYTDESGNISELDIWKVDFSPLHTINI